MKNSQLNKSALSRASATFCDPTNIKWYINHEGNFFFYWNGLTVVCCIFSTFIYAYIAAFKDDFDGQSHNVKWWFWEIIFLIDFILHFFIDFYKPNPTGGKIIERDNIEIAHNYFKTLFWQDLIPLIPFQFIQMEKKLQYILYMIKVIRLYKAVVLLNVRYAVNSLKNY